MQEYIDTNYYGNNMTLVGAGVVDHKQLVELTAKHFGNISPTAVKKGADVAPAVFTPSEIRARYDDMPLANIALAVETAGWNDPYLFPLLVMQHTLGSYNRSRRHEAKFALSPFVSSTANEDLAESLESFNTMYR